MKTLSKFKAFMNAKQIPEAKNGILFRSLIYLVSAIACYAFLWYACNTTI